MGQEFTIFYYNASRNRIIFEICSLNANSLTLKIKQVRQMSLPLQQLVKVLISLDESYKNLTFRTLSQAIKLADHQMKKNPIEVAKNIDTFIQILSFTNSDSTVSQQEKNKLFEFIVSLVQRYPKQLKLRKDRKIEIFKFAVDIVSFVSAQINEQWMNPSDDSNVYQTDENVNIGEILDATRKLVIAVGFSNSLAVFQPIFDETLNKLQDWRYIYSLLLVVSQLAAKEAVVESLSKIIQSAFALTTHQHPKIRYAALMLIQEYIKDLSNQFIVAYYDQFIFNINRLLTDPIPRLVECSVNCLGYFYTSCYELDNPQQKVLKQHISMLTENMMKKGYRIKRKSVGTLSAIASIPGTFSQSNFLKIMELIDVASRDLDAQYQRLNYWSHSYNLMSALIANQKQFEPQLPYFVMKILYSKDKLKQDTFFECWSRICKAYKSFADITKIFPTLIKEVKKNKNNHNVYGVNCLIYTFRSFQTNASAFVQQTQTYCIDTLQKIGGRDEIFQEICQLLVVIHSATQPPQQQKTIMMNWMQKVKSTYDYLIRRLKKKLTQKGFQQFACLYKTIEQLIKIYAKWVPLTYINNLVIQQFELCQGLNILHDSLNTQFQIEQEREYLEHRPLKGVHNMSIAWALKVSLRQTAQILKTLFFTSKNSKFQLEMLKMLQTQVKKYIQKPFFADFAQRILLFPLINQSYPKHHNPINLYQNFVMQTLSIFKKSSDQRMKNAAVCGFKAILMRANPSSLTSQQVQQLLNFFGMQFSNRLMKTCFDDEKQFDDRRCKDIVISALGYLLSKFSTTFPTILNQQIYKFWLNNLPLNTSIVQGDKQQQFLIEILAKSPQLIIKEPKDILTICQIYAKYVMKRGHKRYKEEVSKTKKSFLMIKQWKQFKQSESYLQQNLSESHKKTLKRLIQS